MTKPTVRPAFVIFRNCNPTKDIAVNPLLVASIKPKITGQNPISKIFFNDMTTAEVEGSLDEVVAKMEGE